MLMEKPIVVIPLGDPCGIGPEIVVKALNVKEVYDWCNPIVVGTESIILNAMKICGINLKIQRTEHPRTAAFNYGVIQLYNVECINLSDMKIGEVQGIAGAAAYAYIEKSTKLILSGEADALATTPINKESFKAGGVNFIGHTEVLEHLTGATDPLTMFEVRDMRVFFLTRHVSLRKACDLVTKERVLDYIKRCTDALRRLGIKQGTMAVAGLNPHSGEHGLFGDEEVKYVEPAVKEAQAQGYDVVGPIGADSVFHLALQGRFNSVLSLYHDQGHIATKTLDFERTISITNGLPFLRTSVDHGTALDIAGKGIASEVSLVEAIRLAAKYAPSFNKS
ncbi:MAG: 4-hydroxythreonine-4-phosphate dehydrogenase PdxA [Bacillota bacterium]|nr:4-hydroxythreonine-4-phosphate dehydrogenase PdxA [Bacillota bacterium]